MLLLAIKEQLLMADYIYFIKISGGNENYKGKHNDTKRIP